ncbi:MAG: 4-hydroxy-3-methylbut-2-enyl diphosphate reductase [Gammaproteobacteria bacterium]|nr:4-hydroxy-3-methylbut-2-enyl diphosphate reductase [Gammaproteobacteria bacterium]
MKIILANPRGFCAGVNRAIEIVERALELHGAPIYVRHEVVHNKFVVSNLRKRGAIFVEELDEVPADATVIFSAHGVSKAVRNEAKRRKLKIFDATCPLVTKVHLAVERHSKEARDVILIGHAGHPEVEGTLGQYERRNNKATIHIVETPEDVAQLSLDSSSEVAYSTQTTLSMDDTSRTIDALRQRYSNLSGPKKNDICYATQNRQDAVKQLARQCDLVFVVGSKNSSNSNRLREIAQKMGVDAYLIDGPEDIDPTWLNGKETIGITAGASAPELLVEWVIDHLKTLGASSVEEAEGEPETTIFPLPSELRRLT